MKIYKLKKLGIPKRLLWIWETICYSWIIAYGLQSVFNLNMNISKLVVVLCSPTVLLMLVLGKYIYEDKIKWSCYKPYEAILPLIVVSVCGVYGLIIKSNTTFLFVVGIIIPYVLLIIVGTNQNSKKSKNKLNN